MTSSMDFNDFRSKFIEKYGLDEDTVAKTCKMQLVIWEKNAQGNLVAYVNGRQVYPEKNYIGVFEPGQIWIVKIKEPNEVASYCWAIPVEKLTPEDIFKLGGISIQDLIYDSRGGIKSSFCRALDKDMPNLSAAVDMIQRVSAENEQLKIKVNNLNQAFQDVKIRMTAQMEDFADKEKKLRDELNDANNKLAKAQAESVKSSKADTTKDRTIKELQTKVFDMEKKVAEAEINTQNLRTKDQREIDALKEQIGKLEAQKEAVAKAKRPLDEEIKALRSTVESQEQEIKTLKSAPVKTVQADVSQYVAQIESLKAELLKRDRQLAELSSETEEEKVELLPEFDPDFKPTLTIRRDSPTTLASDWFTAPRYSILMSLNPMVLLIRPDPEGMVVCSDYTIDIDGLDRMTEFKPKRTGGSQYLDVQFTRDMTAAKVAL